VAHNASLGGQWEEIEEAARPLVALEANLVGTDPGFVDAAHGDFRLKPGSQAASLGFQAIPFEQIGPRAPAAKAK
jgi:hypothetical protein